MGFTGLTWSTWLNQLIQLIESIRTSTRIWIRTVNTTANIHWIHMINTIIYIQGIHPILTIDGINGIQWIILINSIDAINMDPWGPVWLYGSMQPKQVQQSAGSIQSMQVYRCFSALWVPVYEPRYPSIRHKYNRAGYHRYNPLVWSLGTISR